MNSIGNNNQSIVEGFDHLEKKDNGKYLKATLFNKKISLPEMKKKYFILSDSIFKDKSVEEAKRIHEYRIKALNEMNNKFETIIKTIKKTTLSDNKSLKLTIQNTNQLADEILNLLKDETINTHNGIELIDKEKLQKIKEKDFTLVMKQIISNLDEAKDYQYIYQFIKKLTNEAKISVKTAGNIKKVLEAKVKYSINNCKITTPSTTKDNIFELHALLAVCKLHNIYLSIDERKKISEYSMQLFTDYSTNITPNKQNLEIVKQQLDEFENIKNNLIIPIIEYSKINVKKNINHINKNLVTNANILKNILSTTTTELNFLKANKLSLLNKFAKFLYAFEATKNSYIEAKNTSKHKKRTQKKYQASREILNKESKDFLYEYNRYKHHKKLLEDHTKNYGLTIDEKELTAIENYFDSNKLEAMLEKEIMIKAKIILASKEIQDKEIQEASFLKLVVQKIQESGKQKNKLTVLLAINSSLEKFNQAKENNLSMFGDIFTKELDETIEFMTSQEFNKSAKLDDGSDELDQFSSSTYSDLVNVQKTKFLATNKFDLDSGDSFKSKNKSFNTFFLQEDSKVVSSNFKKPTKK